MRAVAYSPPAEVKTDAVTEPYWASLREGVLSLQRCTQCRRFRMPPTLYCPHCLATESEWSKLSGRGRLYSYTVIAVNPRDSNGPCYVPALVCPEEAPDTKLFSNVVDCEIEDLDVGMALELVRADNADVARFRPAPASGENR